jgi:hypothetical protein
MNPLFAMANLSGAEASLLLPASWYGLLAAGVLLFFGWLRQSWRFALAACIIVLVLGVLLQPWRIFISTPMTWEDDPDYVHWRLGFRIVSVVWVAALVTTGRLAFGYSRHKQHAASRG